MTKSSIQRDYFKWLLKLVDADENYSMLWTKLMRTDYIWIIERDGNRAKSGSDLRYIFAVEEGYNDEEQALIKEYLVGPCSVLELIVSLARTIEMDIMGDAEYEDRTKVWFHDMIDNLGLTEYDNKYYDDCRVDYILNRFMQRKYSNNGDGNLFKYKRKNLKNIELWEQMQEYLYVKYGS